jgi:hypothetical protein
MPPATRQSELPWSLIFGGAAAMTSAPNPLAWRRLSAQPEPATCNHGLSAFTVIDSDVREELEAVTGVAERPDWVRGKFPGT